jgi:hypothetical protein
MAINWEEIFARKPNLRPPGHLQAKVDLMMAQIWHGWRVALLDIEKVKEKERKKQETKRNRRR